MDAEVAERDHTARTAHPADGLDRAPGLRVGEPYLLRAAARPADADGGRDLGKQLTQPADAQGAELPRPGSVRAGRGQHHGHLGVPHRDDRARRPCGEEVPGGCRGALGQREPGLPWRGLCRIEGDGQHVVVVAGVVAEVRGPPAGFRRVPAAPGQQPLHQVVADPAGGRGHDAFPAEYHAADRGRVLGQQQAGVLAGRLAAGVQREQVGGHVVADQDRCDDHRGGGSHVGQPQRPPGPAGRAEHVAEPGVDHQVAYVLGGAFGGFAGRRGGQDVHGRAHDRDRGVGLLGDQLGHRGDVGVLDGEPGQMPVDRNEVTQRKNLAGGLAARPRRAARARRPLALAHPLAARHGLEPIARHRSCVLTQRYAGPGPGRHCAPAQNQHPGFGSWLIVRGGRPQLRCARGVAFATRPGRPR